MNSHPPSSLKIALFVLTLVVVVLLYKSATTEIPPLRQESFPILKRRLSSRIAPTARLGNHIFELAAVLGISRMLNRTATFFIEDEIYRRMIESSKEAIPGLVGQFEILNGKVPPYIKNTKLNTRCCVFVDPLIHEHNNDEYLHLDGRFYQAWKYFPSMRNELIGYLKTSENFGSLPKSNETSFVTCVHIRRGDFKRVGFAESDEWFIRKAKEFVENKEATSKPRSHVVLFGDDLPFMKNLYENVSFSNETTRQNSTHFVSVNSPSDDLVYAKKNCDTVLITAPHSTFGWWMGYFSKGDKVYYMDIRETRDNVYRHGGLNPYDYYLPHWTPLKFAGDNTTIVESLK